MQNKPFDMPLVQSLPLEATPPSLQDNTADIDRLKLVLVPVLQKAGLVGRECIVPFAALPRVAAGFRSGRFSRISSG